MGKSKNKTKTKHTPEQFAELSKKERKALEARAVELEAKLAAKANKKAGKGKSKKAAPEPLTKAERDALKPAPEVEAAEPKVEPAAGVAGDETHSPLAILEVADKVLADPNSSDGAKESARKARSKALESLSTKELKSRVQARNAARAALEAADIDRDDDAAVRTYNAALAELGGSHFLTSTQELAQRVATVAGEDAVELTPSEVQIDEVAKAEGKRRKAKADELVVELDGETLAAPQVATEVETETGREFAVGTSEATTADIVFGKPSDAPAQLEEGRNGYKIMVLKDGVPDPKTVRQFTRVTTYIDNLEDKTQLEKWKMRTLLEGAVIDLEASAVNKAAADAALSTVRSLMHTRDVAVAKAAKADRKGKLEVGERAQLETAAYKVFKDAVNVIADELLELGGVHEKANKGTNLHALCELYDAEGMVPINDKLKADEITKTDHASVVAYAEAMLAAGIKVVASEVVVVNDALKYAGRLDRILLVKFPGTQRAVRCVGDIKSGSLDFGQGKVAQQTALYANAQGYDLETGERTDLKLSKTKGVVIHLPQGTGECHIYAVDLTLGSKGSKISGEVRAWRNEGKKAIDFTVDLASPEAPAAEPVVVEDEVAE